MRNRVTSAAALCVLAALLGASRLVAQAQDPLLEVKTLYAAAQYDEALNALERVGESARGSVAALEYHGLCMLALGRTKEAEAALATLIEQDPSYQPDASSASPRFIALFKDVRRRTLPVVIQKGYAAGKSAYDEHRYEEASGAFDRVLALLEDPDLTDEERLRLGDLRTIAGGFRDPTYGFWRSGAARSK
jgi:tetratricopeptide (TPR) repeat protein